MTYLIAAVKEKHKFDICFLIHDSVPTLKVVLVTGETIYEETKLLLIFLHGLFHCLKEQEQKENNSYSSVYWNDQTKWFLMLFHHAGKQGENTWQLYTEYCVLGVTVQLTFGK